MTQAHTTPREDQLRRAVAAAEADLAQATEQAARIATLIAGLRQELSETQAQRAELLDRAARGEDVGDDLSSCRGRTAELDQRIAEAEDIQSRVATLESAADSKLQEAVATLREATTPRTTKQQALDAALGILEEIQSEQAKFEEACSSIDEQIAALSTEEAELAERRRTLLQGAIGADAPPKEAAKLAGKLAEMRGQIADLQEARALASARLHEASLRQGPATMACQKARVALQREPCELALYKVDEVLRQLEAAWLEAGREAAALDRADDGWGTGHLHDLRNHLTNAGFVGSDGICVLHVPRFQPEA